MKESFDINITNGRFKEEIPFLNLASLFRQPLMIQQY